MTTSFPFHGEAPSLYTNTMYYYRNTTQTPNLLFDHLLKQLSLSELKVLLTIVRKTLGQVDPKDVTKRLSRAWISQKLFMHCCNLSGRAVSSAIDSLVHKQLIEVTNLQGAVLETKWERRGVSRLYYASLLRLDTSKKQTSESTSIVPVKDVHTIKLNKNKLSCYNKSQGIKRLSDVHRFKQIQKNRNLEQ